MLSGRLYKDGAGGGDSSDPRPPLSGREESDPSDGKAGMLSGRLYKDYEPPSLSAPPSHASSKRTRLMLDAASAPEPDSVLPVIVAERAESPRFVSTRPVVPIEAVELQNQELMEGTLGIIHDAAINSTDGDDRHGQDLRYIRPKETNVDLPVRRAQMVLRKAALAYSSTMFEREVLKEVIEEDHHRWSGCITLPISVLYFVFYLMAVTFHEAVTFMHITTTPARTALQDGLGGIVTPDDVYTFLQDTCLPFFFTQYDGLGNQLPPERWSVISQYSHLVGSAQLELQRSNRQPCQEMAEFVECYPQDMLTGETFGLDLSSLPPPVSSVQGSPWSLNGNWSWWDASSSPSSAGSILECADEGFSAAGCGGSRRLMDVRHEIEAILPQPDGGGPKYTFTLDSRMPYAQLYNRLEYLKKRGWLDAQSTTLRFQAVILNNQLGNTPRVVDVNAFFFFSRGGGVYTDLKVEGRQLELYSEKISYVADGLFASLLVIRSLGVLMQICQAVRKRRCGLLLNATFWIAFLTLGLSYINILFLFLQEILMGSVRKNLEAYFSDPSAAVSAKLYQSVDDVTWLSGWSRPLVAYANIFFLCQVIIALQWQPRLAVVTQTLLACSSDLFHYLIVLLLTVTGFALSGMVIFGRRVIDFAQPFAAIAFCFKLAVESEYDWQTLSDKEWYTSFAWVVLYLLLVVMLMVNMVLAIIMDVYAEVSMHAGESMSIFAHLMYIYRKLYYRKQWVPDYVLYDQVSEMPTHITLLEVRQAFPDMHHHQLEYLQEQCKNKAGKILRVGINTTYMMQIVAAIGVGLEEVYENLRRLKARGWMGRVKGLSCAIEAGSDESREWVKNVFSSIAHQQLWMGMIGKQINGIHLMTQGTSPAEEEARHRQARLITGRSVKDRSSRVASLEYSM